MIWRYLSVWIHRDTLARMIQIVRQRRTERAEGKLRVWHIALSAALILATISGLAYANGNALQAIFAAL